MIEYVYGEVVVVKTGRIAHKPEKTVSTKRRQSPLESGEQVMYEIEPAVGDIKWKKWVKDEDLYVIEQPKSSDDIPCDISQYVDGHVVFGDELTDADYLKKSFHVKGDYQSDDSQDE